MRAFGASLAVIALAACSSAPPPPPAPSSAPASNPTDDLAHKAVSVALGSLAKRNFPSQTCDAASAKVVKEEELAAPSPPPAACEILVARQMNTKWTVVVRPKPPEGQPAIQAQVTVSSEAEGVQGIKYDKR